MQFVKRCRQYYKLCDMVDLLGAMEFYTIIIREEILSYNESMCGIDSQLKMMQTDKDTGS